MSHECLNISHSHKLHRSGTKNCYNEAEGHAKVSSSCFMWQRLSLNWEPSNWTDWLPTKDLGSAHLCVSKPRLQAGTPKSSCLYRCSASHLDPDTWAANIYPPRHLQSPCISASSSILYSWSEVHTWWLFGQDYQCKVSVPSLTSLYQILFIILLCNFPLNVYLRGKMLY